MAKKTNKRFRNSLGGKVLAGAMSLAQLFAIAACSTDTPEQTKTENDTTTTTPKPWEIVTFGDGLDAAWQTALKTVWADYIGYPTMKSLVENKYETIKFQAGTTTKTTANKNDKTLIIEIKISEYPGTTRTADAVNIMEGSVLPALQAAAQTLLKDKINAAYLASARENAAFTKQHVRTLFAGRSYGA